MGLTETLRFAAEDRPTWPPPPLPFRRTKLVFLFRYRPDLVHWDSLDPGCTVENIQLAFDILESELGLQPVTTAEEVCYPLFPRFSISILLSFKTIHITVQNRPYSRKDIFVWRSGIRAESTCHYCWGGRIIVILSVYVFLCLPGSRPRVRAGSTTCNYRWRGKSYFCLSLALILSLSFTNSFSYKTKYGISPFDILELGLPPFKPPLKMYCTFYSLRPTCKHKM